MWLPGLSYADSSRLLDGSPTALEQHQSMVSRMSTSPRYSATYLSLRVLLRSMVFQAQFGSSESRPLTTDTLSVIPKKLTRRNAPATLRAGFKGSYMYVDTSCRCSRSIAPCQFFRN